MARLGRSQPFKPKVGYPPAVVLSPPVTGKGVVVGSAIVGASLIVGNAIVGGIIRSAK